MKTSTFAAAFLFGSVLALPAPVPDNEADDKPKCVKPKEAEKFVDRYIGFLSRAGSDLGDAHATGEALAGDDIELHSFSINSAKGTPVNGNGDGLISKGKEDYINNVWGTHALPPQGIHTLSALAACDDGNSKIIWQWQFDSVEGNTDNPAPIRGFTLFSVVRDDGPAEFKIEKVDVEFDSIAWAADLKGSSGQQPAPQHGYQS
ncbi:hypothetical protein CB0940_10981 [Cercospora beticola]|uniref:NTF2-like domain-containing protein n=1 Tax=Cercospora beticola TaxID=122368 RepID=A0A2G5HDS1_CERBT|nr:hypothetical protein CB0940_10981 [Cercospora beticola]PIA90678.1 hypothetical protein CB0940_10981 [Cercospora beticola]WPB07804.1 hypothetical protein RHO25_012468 [Cercospora beticola]